MTDPNFIRNMRNKIRLRFLTVFAAWFGAVCGITALICLKQGFDTDEVAAVFTACMFFGIFVLFGLLGFVGSRLEKNIESAPELFPADDTVRQAWEQTDTYYLQQIRKLTQNRNILIFLGLFLGPFFPAFIIIGMMEYRSQIQKLGLHPGSPSGALKAFIRSRKSLWSWIGFMLLLFSCFLMLFSAMQGFVAKSKVTTLNFTAKSVCQAAITYQTDLELSDEKWQLETTILNQSDDRAENPLHQGIYPYFMDCEKCNYAVICDSDGKVIGALASLRPITEYDLTHPQTLDEQRHYFKSLFHSDEAVGNFIDGKYPS